MISRYKVGQFVLAFNLVVFMMSVALFGSNIDRSLVDNKNEDWSDRKAQVVTKDIESKLQQTVSNITGNTKDIIIG